MELGGGGRRRLGARNAEKERRVTHARGYGGCLVIDILVGVVCDLTCGYAATLAIN